MKLPRSRKGDPRTFLELLYGVIIFECSYIAHGNTVTLAKAFAAVADISKRHSTVLACPCHELIQKYGLNDTENRTWYNTIAHFKLYLFPRIHNPKAGENVYMGYRISESGVNMPLLSDYYVDQFLERYRTYVPAEWKDDIAVIIYELREELGHKVIATSKTILVHDHLRGIRKYSRQHWEKQLSKVKVTDQKTTMSKQHAIVAASVTTQSPSSTPSEQPAEAQTPITTGDLATTQGSTMPDVRPEVGQLHTLQAIQTAADEAKRQKKMQKEEQKALTKKHRAEEKRKRRQEVKQRKLEQEQKSQEAAAKHLAMKEAVAKAFRVQKFIEFLYELIIFELTATYGAGVEITFEQIADAFALATEVLKRNEDVMISAAAEMFNKRLDYDVRLCDFFWSYRPQLLGVSSRAGNFGYTISITGVVLPSWSPIYERDFLGQYDAVVPYYYKDDLAILVWELQNHLSFRGSGGEATLIHGRLQGVKKFKDLDAVKRAIFAQHHEEGCHRQERQKNEKLERLRLEKLGDQIGQAIELAPENEGQHQNLLDLPSSQPEQTLELAPKEGGEEERHEQISRKEEKGYTEHVHGHPHNKKSQEPVQTTTEEKDLQLEEREQRLHEDLQRRIEEGIERTFSDRRRLAVTGQPQDIGWDLEQLIQHSMDLRFYITRATEDRRDQILELKDDLTRELNLYFHQDGLEVLLFGSYQTRLSDNGSDADFSLVDSTGSSVSITVDALAAALRQLGYVNVVAIGSARIPIVTFYERHRSIPCDIALNQRHGAYNSKLIDTYRRIDDRFTSLFFAIRVMARNSRILSGKNRCLTSYALVMMVITFLQTRPKPVLPRLQCQPNMQKAEVDGWDYSFDGYASNYEGFGAANTETAAKLLQEFYRYFGYNFAYGVWEINPRVGAIRSTRVVDVEVDAKERRKLLHAQMCIMDPFIRNRNIAGNITKANVSRIREAFRRASDTLAKGDLVGAFLKNAPL